MKEIILDESLISRFWAKVNKSGPDDCWIWTSSKVWGYGSIASAQCGSYRAHRVSWEINKGPIPADMCVLHRCDVRDCVNPDHLFLGTPKDNTHDMIAKGRNAKLLVGEQQWTAKLTNSDIREIRKLLTTKMFQRDIAERYGVEQSQISMIKNGHTWSHVE